jgi:hypothetical protein
MDQNPWSTQVKATTISNCFSQVGFGVQVNLDPVDEVGEEEVGRSMRIVDPIWEKDIPVFS